MAERVYFREVGPRDALQMVGTSLPTDANIAWCAAAAGAGVPEIEATSFVPAHIVPQFADADEVASGVKAIAEAQMSAIVVILKGAVRAFEAGFRKVNYVVSASEAHSLANARRATDTALDEFGPIVAERRVRGLQRHVRLSCGIAIAFGCTLQGAVSEDRVVAIAERLTADGAEEIMAAERTVLGRHRPCGTAEDIQTARRVTEGRTTNKFAIARLIAQQRLPLGRRPDRMNWRETMNAGTIY